MSDDAGEEDGCSGLVLGWLDGCLGWFWVGSGLVLGWFWVGSRMVGWLSGLVPARSATGELRGVCQLRLPVSLG
jgi:hypothetical protein